MAKQGEILRLYLQFRLKLMRSAQGHGGEDDGKHPDRPLHPLMPLTLG